MLARAYPLPVTSSFSQCCQLQSLSSCCQVQYLGENGLVMALTRIQALSSCQFHFHLPVTLLPAPEPLILLPGTGPGTKQRKTLGWWSPYQEPIPCQLQTLSHSANSISWEETQKGEDYTPVNKYNHLKH